VLLYITCVKPALKIKNRHQLAALLERNDREGLGGIKMSDVEEALANPQRAIRVSIQNLLCSIKF